MTVIIDWAAGVLPVLVYLTVLAVMMFGVSRPARRARHRWDRTRSAQVADGLAGVAVIGQPAEAR